MNLLVIMASPVSESANFRYEISKTFHYNSIKQPYLPDLIFLGICSHQDDEHQAVTEFLAQFKEKHRYQVILERTPEEVKKSRKISYLKSISKLEVKGWDDPDLLECTSYLDRLSHFVDVLWNPESYAFAEYQKAYVMLKGHYDHYVDARSKGWIFKKRLMQFPDKTIQGESDFSKSIVFLRRIVDKFCTKIKERNYLERQKSLCESIVRESQAGRSSIWISGASHYSSEIANLSPYKVDEIALKHFHDTVKSTNMPALVIIAKRK